ncbi:MAG: hypothetical protein IT376_01910 [Polyangiaceae bacterium]|nr:hypothetical protein [Polyangiaceae bacterium]
MRWLSRLGAVAAPAWLALVGCESIAGIEDRRFEAPDSGGSQASPLCVEYCAEVLESCTGALAVYTTEQTCLATCALLDPGDPLEPAGNTVACRLKSAKDARAFEPELNCPRAGPGGAGFCGDDCASYCSLLESACPEEAARYQDCPTKCAAGLRDTGRFDVVLDHDGDSLQCRLVHVSSAAVAPDVHCEHARLTATAPCTDPQGTVPDCEEYCALVNAACAGALGVYESQAQCVAACAAIPAGTVDDRMENTVGCRKYHAHAALGDPGTHCPHASPLGDGHCGHDATPTETGNCESYCLLLEAACPAEAATLGGPAACRAACAGVPGAAADSHYAVAAATGDTLACRALHVTRAFADSSACAAAVGGAPCQ